MVYFRKDLMMPFDYKFSFFYLNRGMEDESGDQFVAYFLPSDETLRKRKREDDSLTMQNDDE